MRKDLNDIRTNVCQQLLSGPQQSSGPSATKHSLNLRHPAASVIRVSSKIRRPTQALKAGTGLTPRMTSPFPTCNMKLSAAHAQCGKGKGDALLINLKNDGFGLPLLCLKPFLVGARVENLAIHGSVIINFDLYSISRPPQNSDTKNFCDRTQKHLVAFLWICGFVSFLVHDDLIFFRSFIYNLDSFLGDSFWLIRFQFCLALSFQASRSD